MKIKAGARGSALARAQFEEIQSKVPFDLEPVWIETRGDKDKKTSLRKMEKNDFFTRELDRAVLEKEVRIAIHSAKDLPEPMPDGLCTICITVGIDPRDSLVFREGMSLKTLKSGAVVATSSIRREEVVKSLRSDLCFIDLRGTIEERLFKLESGDADAIVVAEAALIRLNLTHLSRMFLTGKRNVFIILNPPSR